MNRPYTHPGEILLEEFIKPNKLTQEYLCSQIGTSIKTISEICNKKRGISPVMAHKLSRFFGTTPEFWLNAQVYYDLYIVYEKKQEEIDKVRPLSA